MASPDAISFRFHHRNVPDQCSIWTVGHVAIQATRVHSALSYRLRLNKKQNNKIHENWTIDFAHTTYLGFAESYCHKPCRPHRPVWMWKAQLVLDYWNVLLLCICEKNGWNWLNSKLTNSTRKQFKPVDHSDHWNSIECAQPEEQFPWLRYL